MQRTVSRIPMDDDGTVVHRTKIESPECDPGTELCNFHQRRLFQMISDRFELTSCGPAPFQKMRVYHDGSRWVLEAEATVRESIHGQAKR